MKVRVLGCSAVELPNANLTSFLIDGHLLLDAGTIGTALNENEQWKIKNVLITHAHLDHIKDIPFFADNISMNNKKQNVTLMSIPEVIQALKNNLFNDIVWPDFTKIPSTKNPIIKLKNIHLEKPFKINSYKITAYGVNHTVPSVGYLIEDKKGKRLLYMGDSGPSDTIWYSLNNKRIQVLIIEVSLPNKSRDMAIKTGHLTPKLLASELKKIAVLPERIYITHCKPKYRDNVVEELKNLKINNIKALKDGDIFEL